MDEVENASAELLGAVDMQVNDATRQSRRSYARSCTGEVRVLGGMNWLLLGDVYQIPPVRATSITASPFEKHSSKVQRILDMIWSRGFLACNTQHSSWYYPSVTHSNLWAVQCNRRDSAREHVIAQFSFRVKGFGLRFVTPPCFDADIQFGYRTVRIF